MATLLKRWVYMLGMTRYIRRESRRKKNEIKGAPISVSLSFDQKDLFVRIVHAGGIVELYQDVIPASTVMEKYPGMCVARPEVFKQPQDSLLRPEEKLVLGQKYYLVPCTTMQKLKRRHQEKFREEDDEEEGNVESLGRQEMVNGEVGDLFEESVCSAKDYYVSRDKLSDYVQRRCGKEQKKPFTPPIKKKRFWQGMGWQPSLTSVEELSP